MIGGQTETTTRYITVKAGKGDKEEEMSKRDLGKQTKNEN